jgi:indole-3-glycerol phosphate synthase
MNRDFLYEIVARKRHAIAKLRASSDADGLRNRALVMRKNSRPHRLRQTLEAKTPAIKIIAEFKRKSPSRGMIRGDLSPVEAAHCYERGGARAISVLTEEEYFGGSIDDLAAVRRSTPLSILRKDFVIDPIQVYEAAATGADAVLLIAAILEDDHLAQLRAVAEDELGLDAVIEVHGVSEMRRAQNIGAKLMGVNNRNLRTFEVSLDTSEELIAEAPREALMISESGLHTSEQLRRLQTLGFHGFLIGEALMQAPDPAEALRELMI